MKSLLYIDGYKLDHRRQYFPGTEYVQTNMTPRGSRIPDTSQVGWLGLQRFCAKYLMEELIPFFAHGRGQLAMLENDLERYKRRVDKYLGPNTIGTAHIRALANLGYIPLRVSAVPEGSYVPLRVPFVLVENTHPDFFWLPNYYETLLSSELWGSITSMTTAGRFRVLCDTWAEKTGTPKAAVDYQCHDFSFRGMMGVEAAKISGIGHLAHFKGTDTMPAIEEIEDYYGFDRDGERIDPATIGNSVAATEHSVMCSGGQAGERDTILRLFEIYPTNILSVVADTWNLWHVLTVIVPSLKERILARDGKLVIRPDSGDPVKIICGDPDAPDGSPARKGVVQLLWDIFGGTETSTGHWLLDSHIGAIYGDGISYERAQAIFEGLAKNGFASGNVVLGLGSFTYQYVTRDTYNIAMKATWAQCNGEGRALWKCPVTDDGTKFSARGRLAVLRDESGTMQLIENCTKEQERQSLLKPVWENGRFLIRTGWDRVRANAREALRDAA